jgi:hypothetical protein
MKRLPVLAALVSVLCSMSFAAVHVTVSAPTNNASSSAPLHLVASALSSNPITGWVAYSDSKIVYIGPPSANIDTWVPLDLGSHQLVVRAWDSHGGYGSQNLAITVVSDGLPTPPANAVVYDNIQQRGNWGSCHDPGCAGGSGQGTYWMAQNQGSPSMSGSSTQLYNSGVWANALWWQKLGPANTARNFLWDFYFYVDNNYNVSAQSLEFDAFQFLDGYNYMMGTQCDYWLQIWDTWDSLSGQWMHTNIPCPHFATRTWHHVQLYTQTTPAGKQYKYVTLVVDGKSVPMNITRNALYLNWANNMGVQWQLDVNANGSGYNEWVDNAKLTVW